MPVDEWQAQQERFARMEARIATLEGALKRANAQLYEKDYAGAHITIQEAVFASTPQPSEGEEGS